MIRSFRHKALAELWAKGHSSGIDARLHSRIRRRLAAVDRAVSTDDLIVPGFDFHALRGFSPTRFTIHVNGPWCITFEFDGDAFRLYFEQYH